jgi:hypothetical protein
MSAAAFFAVIAFSLPVLTERPHPTRLFLKNRVEEPGSPASKLAGVEEKPYFAALSSAE